jgi:tRNA 2-selenouridine synthase
LEKRIDYLVEAYGKYSPAELIESIEKIRKRVGFQNAKSAIEAINNGDLKRACEISLVYYDKSYDHGVAKRSTITIHKKQFEELNPAEIARGLSLLS